MNQERKIFTIKKTEILIDSKESVDDLVECIKNLEIEAISIGEGENAVVYTAFDTVFEKLCIKKIKERPRFQLNNLEQEHKYQVMAKEGGVRTPISLISISTDDGKYLIMERIEGNTVDEIIKNPNLLPKDFDFKIFCDSFDDQIEKMHRLGLYHRDLHSRNVMIDKEGLPVIIDFGLATEGSGSEFTYEESVSMFDAQRGHYVLVDNYFKDDLEMAREMKNSLQKSIFRNNLT